MYQFFKRKSFLHYYLPLFVIIWGSFYFFSYGGYPLLNSDDAVTVLMAHDYSLPSDFYYWGQDRLGTLIPLISQIGIYFGLSALWAVSISTYLILILGFIGFSLFLEKKESKLLFALILFFPFERFADILRSPVGIEYCLLGFSLYLLKQRLPFILKHNPPSLLKFAKETTRKKMVAIGNFLVYLFQLAIVPIFIVAAIWVSDMAVVSLVIFFVVFEVYRKKFHSFRHQAKVISFSILIAYLLVSSFKSISTIEINNDLEFNNFSEFFQGIKMILHSIFSVLFFRGGEFVVGLYAWLGIICVGFILTEGIRQKSYKVIVKRPYMVIFLANFFVLFVVILSSKWVLSSGMERWYFCGVYLSFSLFLLLLVEKMNVQKHLRYLIWTLVFVGASSSLVNMKMKNPGNLTPKAKIMREFSTLGNIGLIGNYENSYIVSICDPANIKATPHDKEYVRSQEMVDYVFNQNKIFLIKDQWLESFPPTITQFGRKLTKVGVSLQIGGYEICQYKKLPN